MNRHHHRIVFNAARGQLMAVSETATACTGSAATGERPASTTQRWRRAGAALLTALAALPSQAQISADPAAAGNLRPTVLSAPNGVPLVNIQTPSAAGVSRNVYRQFDVGSQGAILNNSRTNVPTQLGGWVQGNPWLATGPARVILNEINSSQPSHLNGWVEVGGQRAEVVIANPAGIQVSGGGFINASRATLTTGTPLMNAGALQGFRVQGGQVRVEGLGLDANQSEHLAILARAIEVNAGIWAQALTAVAGVNDVSADTTGITPLAAASGGGPVPAFALDVAALGGMYAGQIHLVGTEAGVGVRNAGSLGASAGALVLEANGWLHNSGSLIAAQTLDLKTAATAGITQHGLLDAQTTRITTGELVNEGAGRIYGDSIDIHAPSLINDTGAVVAARNTLTARTDTLINREGALLLSAGDMALAASARLENRSASIEALGKLDITTPVLVNANDHFESTIVQGTPAPFLRLVHNGVEYTPEEIGANFGPLNSYLNNPGFSLLLPSDEFPFSEFPTDVSTWATRANFSVGGGGLSFGPIVGSAFAIAYSRSTRKTCRDCNWEIIDNYPADHGIWAKFGVASFGSAPTYGGPDCETGAACSTPQWAAYNAYQAALTTYAAQKAVAQDRLDQKVAAFNLSVGSRTLRDWVVIDGTATEFTPAVLASSPARILAGGNMNIHAGDSFVNDKSEVIAGGVLTTTGAKLRNIDADVLAHTEVRGQSVYSYYSEDCNVFCNDDRKYLYTDYAADKTRPVGLPVSRVQDGVSAPGFGTELTSLHTSALFQINTQSNARFLVETDPRFTDKRQWLSSDYLLSALASDPATVQKRLGDGFYEQRLISEQVSALTGHRFLGDFTTDDEQYRQLMDAGVTFAQAHQLRPGIALSAAQVALLTSDIVWLETQTVTLPDGSTTQALVPRVYLLPRAGDLSAGGALIAGRDVQLNLSGDFLNTGSVAGRDLVQINAQNVLNTGLVSGQSGVITAREDVNNIGGTITATDALIVQAGRDLNVQTTTAQGSGAAGVGRYSSEQLNRVAGLYVSGTAGVLLASAGRDVNLTAAVLQASGAQGNVQVQAGRDLNMATVNTGSLTDLNWDAHNRLRVDRREETGTRITGGGDVTLRAGQDITGRAIQVQAGGDLSAVAERNVVIEAGEATFEVDAASRTKSRGPVSSKTTTTKITHRSAQAQVSQLQGQNVEVLGTNIVSVGTRIQGQDSVHIEGTDQTLLYAAQDRSFTQVDVTTKRSSVVGPKYRKTESTDIQFNDVGIGTELISDEAVRIGVGERTELIGARVSAPSIEFTRSENAAPDAAGELLLGAVVEKDVHSHQSKTVTDGVWQKVISKGHETETLKSTELHGQVRFDPSIAISAQIPAGALRQQIEQLVQQPGLAYLGALTQREGIDWQAIELAQRQWHDKQQGLTGAGAAILTLVVAYFTAGMGTAAVGTTSAVGTTTVGGATLATTTAAGATVYTAAGAAVNAAFTSLASTAAVSFVNNGGDLGAVFKDLGSSANVKQLITGMLTAGIVNNLSSQLTVGGKQLADIKVTDGFTSYFSKSLIEQSTSAVVNSALNGASLQDGLQAALISSALGSATALGANAIGDLGLLRDLNGQPVLNPAGKALLHALVGCAGGAAQAGSTGCAAGASGAVLGELAAAWYDPNGTKPRADTEAFAAAVAGLGGVLAGDESGVGVNIAAAAGRNAAANNYLNHVERGQLQRAQRDCLSGQAAACQTASALRLKDELSDRLLADSVARCVGDACREVANFAYEEMRRVGCPMPSACPDQGALQQYWKTAQAKAQGLTPVYPEEWLFDIKAATDLARAGLRVLSASGADASMQALKRLRTAPDAPPDMPGFGANAVRDFAPGSTHRAEVVNAGQVTDRDLLPRVDEIKTLSDDQQGLNAYSWMTQRPAWKEGTLVTDRMTTQTETFRMVVDEGAARVITDAINAGDYAAASRALGTWATKDPIHSVTDVRNNLAISSEWKGQSGAPMFVVEFKVQPGAGLREGTVGPMYDRGVSKTLQGGGHQVQFLQNGPKDDPSRFLIQPDSLRRLP